MFVRNCPRRLMIVKTRTGAWTETWPRTATDACNCNTCKHPNPRLRCRTVGSDPIAAGMTHKRSLVQIQYGPFRKPLESKDCRSGWLSNVLRRHFGSACSPWIFHATPARVRSRCHVRVSGAAGKIRPVLDIGLTILRDLSAEPDQPIQAHLPGFGRLGTTDPLAPH